MDTDSFIVHVKTDDIYKDIREDVETRFDTSHFEIDRPLPKGENKKSDWTNERWIMKNHDGQIMKEFGGLRVKTSSYLKVNNDKDKKAKSTKKVS